MNDILDAASSLCKAMPEGNDQYHRGVIALAAALILGEYEEEPAERLIAHAVRGWSQ